MKKVFHIYTVSYTTLVLLLLVLFGCRTMTPAAKPTATSKEAAALVAANTAVADADGKAKTAAVAANAKTDERDAKVKANVTAAQEWNTQNPEGNPKVGVNGELTVALSSFSDVTADPVEQAAAASRRALIEAGKAAEAISAYQKANQQALGFSADLAKAKAAVVQADAERDAAIASEKKGIEAHAAQLEQNRIANQAAIDKVKEDAKKGVLHQQATWLNLLGVAGLVAFGVSVWMASMTGSIISGAKSAWPFGVFAVICFGLAQLVSQAWFMYAVLGGLLVVGAVAVGWAVKQHRQAQQKAAAEKTAATVTSALNHVVPVLDAAYNNAPPEEKKTLDATVFDKLNVNMDAADKATIHDIRSGLASSGVT